MGQKQMQECFLLEQQMKNSQNPGSQSKIKDIVDQITFQLISLLLFRMYIHAITMWKIL